MGRLNSHNARPPGTGPGISASSLAQDYEGLPEDALARHYLDKPLRTWPLSNATESQIRNAEAVLAGRFTYAGETHELPRGFAWSVNPSRDKEWQIAHHKHYFAIDLCQAWRATGEQRFVDGFFALTESWLDEMGSGFIKASDAQVEAKRVESWVTALLVLRASPRPATISPSLICRLVKRIGCEAEYISRNLKASRNHRTFQLYAMFVSAVLFPELRASSTLQDMACRGLVDNLLQDFTPSGVHIERSTHYHNITLETALAFLELARLNGVTTPAALDDRLRRALEFSAYMLLPDGEIPLIGDSDTLDHTAMFEAGHRLFGEQSLLWAATRGADGVALVAPSKEFAGYFILTDGCGPGAAGFKSRQHVFYDCAPLGDGSHSHYDLFSFCWSANRCQVVVDPGRYTYHAEPDGDGVDWRHRFKSTRSHNTIEIDGLDQTLYLSKATRPAPGLPRLDRTKHSAKHGPEPEIIGRASLIGRNTDWVMATAVSHEYSPRHTRALVFMKRQYIVLLDHVAIDDDLPHSCVARLHLADTWNGRFARQEFPGVTIVRSDDWTIAMSSQDGAGHLRVDEGSISKSYGSKASAPVLALPISGSHSFNLCTVLLPHQANGCAVKLKGVSWLSVAQEGAGAVEICCQVDGRECRDVFMLATNGRGQLITAGLIYTGSLAAARVCDGRVQHVCGATPLACSINGVNVGSDGNALEWSAQNERA